VSKVHVDWRYTSRSNVACK